MSENEEEKKNISENNKEKNAKPIYKKWWFWVLVVIIIAGLGSQGEKPNNNNFSDQNDQIDKSKEIIKNEVIVADFSTMTSDDITSWFEANKVKTNKREEYSDTIEKGSFIRQSVKSGEKVYEGEIISIIYSRGKEPSTEFKNALRKAESYSNTLNMSKQGIYDQLTSQYGEKFPADAAQYAIDNLTVDFNANALKKAKSYQKTMSMSKSAIYDQLTSQYGEKFTAVEAQYAIDHLED